MAEMQYASNGKGNLGVTLGAIGTGLALMTGNSNGCGNNGILGGLFNNNSCSDGSNCYINRYELDMANKISTLETEVKLRDANFYTITQISDLRNYVDNKFTETDRVLAQQAVHNATQNGVISAINTQVQTLLGVTKTVIPNDSVCPGWGPVCTQPIACPTTANVVTGTLN